MLAVLHPIAKIKVCCKENEAIVPCCSYVMYTDACK